MGSADGLAHLLSEDSAHYNEAFKVFLDGNNMQDAKLELVQKYVPEALQHASKTANDVPRRVLGIGSSKGDIDISILEAIAEKQLTKSDTANIFNKVVEPNDEAIANFSRAADEWQKSGKVKAEVNFDWVQATFQDYQDKIKHEQNQFDFIHFVGSIYYVDPEDAIRHCLERELTSNGVLFVACIADNSFLAHFKEKFHDTGVAPFPPGYAHLTSNFVRKIAEKNGWKHEYYEANWFQDISVLDNPESRESHMLLDFTTHTLNFEQVRGKGLAERVRQFMISESDSKPDGRRVIDVNKYGVVLIYPS